MKTCLEKLKEDMNVLSNHLLMSFLLDLQDLVKVLKHLELKINFVYVTYQLEIFLEKQLQREHLLAEKLKLSWREVILSQMSLW